MISTRRKLKSPFDDKCKELAEFTLNCLTSIGMIAVMALLDEDPLVIKIAAINNASIQHFHFIRKSNHVVFDFDAVLAPYIKLGLCRTKKKSTKEEIQKIALQLFIINCFFHHFLIPFGILSKKLHF
jgi:hypothetical protein